MSDVWYAAYGSNLSRARFDIYLRGGRPDGASDEVCGCRDGSDPAEIRGGTIDRALVFGGTSRTWGGGVASVEAGSRGATTLARLYRITYEQFEDVCAQENRLEPGSVELPSSIDGEYVIGAYTYGLVLRLDDIDGDAVLTLTKGEAVTPAPPSDAYLRYIAQGLREAHALSEGEIASYLSGVPGGRSAEETVRAISLS